VERPTGSQETTSMTTPSPQVNIEQLEYDRRWGDPNIHYGDGAPGYSGHFVRFMGQWINKRPAHARVALDVGCGDGYFTSKLIGLGCQATGMDLSPVGLEKAKQRNPMGTFRAHDLTQPFPFEDRTFDVVWCSEVLEHLFSPRYALEQIFRVLKPGGQLLATVPAHQFLKNLAIALFAFDRHYDPEYPHVRFFSKNTLSGLARKVGFEIDFVGTCGSNLGVRDALFPTNIMMVARRPV
jgi:SAM-dependent methyltransferase